MKNILFALSAIAAVAATPAMANEGRVEARGGIAFAGGAEEAIAGVAAGYDFDLGGSGFVGGEVSADKILVGGTNVLFGLTARAGIKTGEAGRLYVTGGYTFNDGDAAHAGAGYQHKFGEALYGKVEYRRFFVDGTDLNAVTAGLGITF